MFRPSVPRSQLPIVAIRLTIVIGGALLVFMLLGWALPRDAALMLFLESGPIESLSAVLWIVTAAAILLVLRPTTLTVLAGAWLCVCGAAREADLHKHWTRDSMLKISYYLSAEHPVSSRLLAGVVFLLLIAAVILVLHRMWQVLRTTDRRSLPLWIAIGVATAIVLVTTKIIDRLPAILEGHGARLGDRFRLALRGFEEGGELLIPLLAAAAVLAYAGHTATHARKLA